MKKKKVPQILNTEDLIKVAEDPTIKLEETIIPYKNDVLTFIATFDIQPGEDKIKKTTLFSIYKVWSKNPIKRDDFYIEAHKLLEATKFKNSEAFKINQNAIKLTHSAYKAFQKEDIKLKSKPWTKHFQNFLDLYRIKKGEFWIEDSIFYFIYDKYTYEMKMDSNKNQTMGKQTFFKYCDLFFPTKITRYGKVYGITQTIEAQFQPDQLDRMRKAYEKEAIDSKK